MSNLSMYGVLCESECGVDAFGNPKGKPILFESTGDSMEYHRAVDRLETLRASGHYGKVLLVKLEVVEYEGPF